MVQLCSTRQKHSPAESERHDMCKATGITGNKTNHRLRATGATELFRRGAREKLIQERTGHRSIEGLRTNDRLSEEQQRAASSILLPPTEFSTELIHFEPPRSRHRDLRITVTDLHPMSESTTQLPPRTDRKHTHQYSLHAY